MPNYGDANYWDERYRSQKNTTFDWLEGWDDLKEIIEKHCIDGMYEEQQINNANGQTAMKLQQSNFLSMSFQILEWI